MVLKWYGRYFITSSSSFLLLLVLFAASVTRIRIPRRFFPRSPDAQFPIERPSTITKSTRFDHFDLVKIPTASRCSAFVHRSKPPVVGPLPWTSVRVFFYGHFRSFFLELALTPCGHASRRFAAYPLDILHITR